RLGTFPGSGDGMLLWITLFSDWGVNRTACGAIPKASAEPTVPAAPGSTILGETAPSLRMTRLDSDWFNLADASATGALSTSSEATFWNSAEPATAAKRCTLPAARSSTARLSVESPERREDVMFDFESATGPAGETGFPTRM